MTRLPGVHDDLDVRELAMSVQYAYGRHLLALSKEYMYTDPNTQGWERLSEEQKDAWLHAITYCLREIEK